MAWVAHRQLLFCPRGRHVGSTSPTPGQPERHLPRRDSQSAGGLPGTSRFIWPQRPVLGPAGEQKLEPFAGCLSGGRGHSWESWGKEPLTHDPKTTPCLSQTRAPRGVPARLDFLMSHQASSVVAVVGCLLIQQLLVVSSWCQIPAFCFASSLHLYADPPKRNPHHCHHTTP